MKKLIYLFIAFTLYSCSHSESDVCPDSIIHLLDMEAYGGSYDYDCKFNYLHRYSHDGSD